MNTTWNQDLSSCVIEQLGLEVGQVLHDRFIKYLPATYCSQYTPLQVASDLIRANELGPDNPYRLYLYTDESVSPASLHLKLFQYNQSIPLSDVLPMIENMGLKTLSEYPHEIVLSASETIVISDFKVSYALLKPIDIYDVNAQFAETFIRVLLGQIENDALNSLILSARLTWQEVTILRAYVKYVMQTKFLYSRNYIEKALCQYAALTRELIEFFKMKHDPKRQDGLGVIEQLQTSISKQLESVVLLDHDRILRRLYDLIKATLRTNFFQAHRHAETDYPISFKLNSAFIPDLPHPKPLYEIFVYSPYFEGIHLRGSKVARGGIRWSDRDEDFRSEILGLMKAQKVKNALIVPSGAKGGFVLKGNFAELSSIELKARVKSCYQSFIRGLLDITDNIEHNQTFRPQEVVCYDDEDPYLVVAADKGTASFSDVANSVASEYQFWLGDAFASGGSAGYDHKKMAITARGAWESARRHLLELDMALDQTGITVAGIGDMSGDVFGNGMLYSNHIKLIAAFDHRDIFLDPDPDTLASHQERQRLFNLPSSSWQDYRRDVISPGGGVYSRQLKSIQITEEVKQRLAITEDVLTPAELIRAILKAPVEMVYNGGIGTYVKASFENHNDVGDRANEGCRINGNELRAKMVVEGGNLGLTQFGRVEYALIGGLINTDFIDNSGGVNCSDHEVNLKILLNTMIVKQQLSKSEVDQLLASMTQEVAKLVLRDNYQQALVMSFSSQHSARYSNLYLNTIKKLESVASLDRRVECLPTDKELAERKAQGLGLTRPELAILLAYTKIHLKNEILKSQLPEDDVFAEKIKSAFPEQFVNQFSDQIDSHPLRREIIATQISNDLVNTMGITYAYRMQAESGAGIADIAKAYLVSKMIFDVENIQKHIAELDYKVPVTLQYELLHHVRYLVNLASRWFLHNNRMAGQIKVTIAHYRQCIDQLSYIIPNLIAGSTKQYLHQLNDQFLKAGLSNDTARRVAISRVMYSGLNVAEIATFYQFDLAKTARVYFDVGVKLGLVTYRDQLANDNREGDLNSLARLALRDELDIAQRALTSVILNSDPDQTEAERLLDQWLTRHQSFIRRWEEVIDLLKLRMELDYTMLFIAMRELSALIAGVDETHVSIPRKYAHHARHQVLSAAEVEL